LDNERQSPIGGCFLLLLGENRFKNGFIIFY